MKTRKETWDTREELEGEEEAADFRIREERVGVVRIVRFGALWQSDRAITAPTGPRTSSIITEI